MAERPQSPKEVYQQINGWNEAEEPLEEWVEKIDIENIPKPDFPHSAPHVLAVRSFASVMADTCNLDTEWKEKIDQAAILHDISQGYTVNGTVPIGRHNSASELIAYMLTGDKVICNLVYCHPEDDLSTYGYDEETMLATAILRDADQLDLSGFTGLLRAAYYWGFRHPLMFQSSDNLLKTASLFDARCDLNGLPNDYEFDVRDFCMKNLFPFLVETNQVDKARSHAINNIYRFFGSGKKEIGFLNHLRFDDKLLEKVSREGFNNLDLIVYKGYSGSVQETHHKYRHLFIRKPLMDNSIVNTCESIIFYQNDYPTNESREMIERLLDEGGRN